MTTSPPARTTFPFTAVVGQDDLKLALLLNAIDPLVGGVLARGQKGTAKSTTVRAMAALLPSIEVVAGDPCNRTPEQVASAADGELPGPVDGEVVRNPTPLVELPVGATEDRLVGSLDIERALVDGARAFEPGLLAAANRGVLYVDEVNLLTDHLVDLLLDAAAMGTNHVEREGMSVRHPARFLLVGTMNPEEGELRPQLLDRFGLTVSVTAPTDTAARSEVVRRRLAHDADPTAFGAAWADEDARLAGRVVAARERVATVALPDDLLTRIAHVCARFEVDGLRADVVIARAARAHAAWEGRNTVTLGDVRVAALLALPHRRRRGPLEEPGIDPDELERILHEPLDDDPDPDPDPPEGRPGRDGEHPHDGDGRQPTSRSPEDRAPSRAPVPPRSRDAGPPPAGDQDAPDVFDDPDAGGADDAEGDPAGEGAPTTVHGVGVAGRPRLLVVPGTGQGARGRRSAATGSHGAAVGTRPRRPGEPATDLSVTATLRVAAPHQAARGRTGAGLVLRGDDLRRHVREGREGNLVVFVVDASGSMGARARMTAVKGAIRSLLVDAYQRRDRLALVTFRGAGAEVVLPPTSSVDVADRRLADLPTGGRTPLGAGLDRATELVATASTRDPDRRPLLVVLTDGRANVGGADPRAAACTAARAVAARRIASVVVDTEDGFVRLGRAAEVATAMYAPTIRLDELTGDTLAGAVRSLHERRRGAA